MNNYKYINVRDYGARGDGQTDDTTAINAAFAAAKTISDNGQSATVFIPPGEYMVGSYATPKPVPALQFSASGCKLTGGGTLKNLVSTAEKPINTLVILRVGGNRNVIDWIRIDGNYSGGALTNTDGLMLAGEFNRARDVFAFNMTPGPTPSTKQGDSLQIFGKACTMKRCIALGGYTSLRDGGDFNIMRYCLGLEYHRKGYNNAFKTTTWTCVIGMHTESMAESTTGAAGYQIDPEDGESDFNRAIFRDCTGRPNVDTESTANGAKFAVIKDVYLDGCQFIHTLTTVTTLRFAEKVDRIRVKDSFLSRDVFIEPNPVPPPGRMMLERVQIGDGVQAPNYAIEQVKCDALLVTDSVLRGYKLGGIEWRSTDATYTLIAATNCAFNGKMNNDVTFDIEPTTGGQLNRSRKLRWLGNRRSNSGTGAASAQFTDTGDSDNILGTTQDASTRVYAHTAAPTSNLVTWAVGDTVMNTSPTSLGYIGWVCTNAASAPGTWKQWGAIS